MAVVQKKFSRKTHLKLIYKHSFKKQIKYLARIETETPLLLFIITAQVKMPKKKKTQLPLVFLLFFLLPPETLAGLLLPTPHPGSSLNPEEV